MPHITFGFDGVATIGWHWRQSLASKMSVGFWKALLLFCACCPENAFSPLTCTNMLLKNSSEKTTDSNLVTSTTSYDRSPVTPAMTRILESLFNKTSSSRQENITATSPGTSPSSFMQTSSSASLDITTQDMLTSSRWDYLTRTTVADVSNVTLGFANITPLAGNDTDNDTVCTNEYCVSNDEYVDMILAYLYPKPFEWLLIAAYMVAFCVGLVGNFLVCFAVWRNHNMRTVTNYFIVNLAVADLMVILICLPPTILVDITETWFMGSAMCKIVKYLQVRKILFSIWL